MMEAEKAELLALLKERAVRWGEFVLSSGKKSDFYVDGKQITLHPRGAYLISKIILQKIQGLDIEGIGGLTIGADPVVGGVVAMAGREGISLTGFIVRKEEKGHGLKKGIEGIIKPKARVVIVDDVITTGKATLQAIRAVEKIEGEVVKVICLVDREEGGKEALSSYPFEPIFRKSELVLG